MALRNRVVVGALAGGVDALRRVVHELPPDFPAAMFVAMHFPFEYSSKLPQILTGAGTLPAAHAADGERIVDGRIFVAPPGLHLTVDREHVRLNEDAYENRYRPSIDVLFRSAASTHGGSTIGVLLSGMLDHGASGLHSVSASGGLTIIQDPRDAEFEEMPRMAMAMTNVDRVLTAGEIGRELGHLVRQEIADRLPAAAGREIRNGSGRLANRLPGLRRPVVGNGRRRLPALSLPGRALVFPAIAAQRWKREIRTSALDGGTHPRGAGRQAQPNGPA
ncbi:MAG: chemotaxis protein CheB [Candidatus Velthaea sp.]